MKVVDMELSITFVAFMLLSLVDVVAAAGRDLSFNDGVRETVDQSSRMELK